MRARGLLQKREFKKWQPVVLKGKDDGNGDTLGNQAHRKKFCNFLASPRTICKFFRTKGCRAGLSGVDNGFVCTYAHPETCKTFCAYGHDKERGCLKSRSCAFFHPRICRKSWRGEKCMNARCPMRHLANSADRPEIIKKAEISLTDTSRNGMEATSGKDSSNENPEISDDSWDLSETWLAEIDREELNVFRIKILPVGNLNNLPSNLQYVVDETTRIPFLIDTGSEISILPRCFTEEVKDQFTPRSKTIVGIGNTKIHPVGKVEMSLKIGLSNDLTHKFWVVAEHKKFGVLGIDFLRKHRLMIIPASNELQEMDSKTSIKLQLPSRTVEEHKSTLMVEEETRERVTTCETECWTLLGKFPELTQRPDYNGKPKHNYTLKLDLDADFEPKMTLARRCNLTVQKSINENFSDLERRGAVIRGDAQLGASPVTVVKKKDGSLRVCVDYTYLNSHTLPLSYPLPCIDQLSSDIPDGTRIFSALDLKEAYFSLPLDKEAKKFMAIITRTGVFIPQRTQFGLKNAPLKFQSMMDDILRPCRGYTFVYLDDILIFSKTQNEHLERLKMVLTLLSNNGLYLNEKKCKFGKDTIEFLGHTIDNKGVTVNQSKVEAIVNLIEPKSKKELRSFLGMVNYYAPHIPRLAEIAGPLNLLTGGSKKQARITLGEEHVRAFKETIAALAKATTLAYEHHGRPLILYSDASETHVGASLEQQSENGVIRPLAFYSKKLPVLKTYRSAFFRELRGIYLSLKHFHTRIVGRQIIIRTDNLSVARALENQSGTQTPEEQRYISIIKEYSPKVMFIQGQKNVVADALSRPVEQTALQMNWEKEEDEDLTQGETVELDWNLNNVEKKQDTIDSDIDSVLEEDDRREEPTTLWDSRSDKLSEAHVMWQMRWDEDESDQDAESEEETSEEDKEEGEELIELDEQTIAECQTECLDLIELAKKSDQTVEYRPPNNIAVIVEEGNARIILPKILRLTAYHIAHNRLHIGIEKSIEAIEKDFWWPELKTDITHWVKSCMKCQCNKTHRHNWPKLGTFPSAPERLQFLHIDTVGPVEPISNGNRYILTIKDRATSFLVTSAIPDKKAQTVRDTIVNSWIACFGVPQVILTDKGKEFRNKLIFATFNQLNIDFRSTDAYSPNTNGMIERAHRSINVALRTLDNHTNWSFHLPLITNALNNQRVSHSFLTPAQYVFGTPTNQSGKLLLGAQNDGEAEYDVYETGIFQINMNSLKRNFKNHGSNKHHYEKGLYDAQMVLVKNRGKGKMKSLFKGPYEVVSKTDQSFTILKNGLITKENIKNLKKFVPKWTDKEAQQEKEPPNRQYNLRTTGRRVNYEELSEGDDEYEDTSDHPSE